MNKTMETSRLGLSIVLTLLLAACGGGGGGGTPAAPATAAATTVVVPYQAAAANLANSGLNATFTISGSLDPSTPTAPAAPVQVSGSGTLAISASTPVTLNGMSVLRAGETTTGSVTVNGQSESLSTMTTLYYNASTYSLYAQTTNGVTQMFAAYAIPTTVQAGSSGSFGTSTDNAASPTTSTGTYSVAADSANSLLVTEVSTVNAPNGVATVTTTTYRVTTTGGITLVSIGSQLFNSGKSVGTLTFKF